MPDAFTLAFRRSNQAGLSTLTNRRLGCSGAVDDGLSNWPRDRREDVVSETNRWKIATVDGSWAKMGLARLGPSLVSRLRVRVSATPVWSGPRWSRRRA